MNQVKKHAVFFFGFGVGMFLHGVFSWEGSSIIAGGLIMSFFWAVLSYDKRGGEG